LPFVLTTTVKVPLVGLPWNVTDLIVLPLYLAEALESPAIAWTETGNVRTAPVLRQATADLATTVGAMHGG
jgi:hypothetical protein